MSVTKGIVVEGCSEVQLKRNTIKGVDVPIEISCSTNVNVEENFITTNKTNDINLLMQLFREIEKTNEINEILKSEILQLKKGSISDIETNQSNNLIKLYEKLKMIAGVINTGNTLYSAIAPFIK